MICAGDADPDLGCDAGETNEEGSGPGFSLPETLINVTLEPVIIPVYKLIANFTYAGPIGSDAFEPNGEKIERVSIITASTNPGKNVKFTITFENESLANAYVHVSEFIDFFSGKRYSYEPTVITFKEEGEFGRRWELHLYSMGFELYEVTGNGLVFLQNGSVEVEGEDVSFTIENFSSIFPERVFMRIRLDCGSSACEGRYPRRTYPSVGSFVIEAMRGWIEYHTEGSYGSPDERVSLYVTATEDDLTFKLSFRDENEYRKAVPMKLYIDATDGGGIDWWGLITSEKFTLYDTSNNVYRESDVTVTKTSIGEVEVEFTVENIFSIIPGREFRFWFAGYYYRFPAKSNLWLDSNNGLNVEKDVERYLVVLVEDVYIKGNKDKAEGEIQMTSWAYGVSWPEGKIYPVEYSEIYTIGYPGRWWVEANDHSRLLYHDENAISVNWTYINGFPVLAMSLDEARKYRRIAFKTMAWDVDDPGKYVSTGVGFLMDVAIGLATAEIGTAVKYAYTGSMWLNQLVTGESATDLWGNVFDWLVGAEPDLVGISSYSIDPHGGYKDGVLVRVSSRDGNMVVTYLIYEVEVPRTLRYASLGAYLPEVSFTKDTELFDDEYYIHARAFTHFVKGEEHYGEDVAEGVMVTPMLPVLATHRYPPGRRVLSGNKLTVTPNIVLIEHTRADVPFIYIEYNAWEEDAGKWGNDDDPMGQVAITILMDDDYFDWSPYSAIPVKEWSLEFPSCGVSGGCSKLWIWVRIKPED